MDLDPELSPLEHMVFPDFADVAALVNKMKAPPATRGEQPPRPVPLPGQTPLVREYLPSDSHGAEDLRAAMRLHKGNQSRAAQSLGLTPRQFGYRWKRVSERDA